MAEGGIRFVTRRHHSRDVDVIEVWFDDRFLATIVPSPESSTATLGIISEQFNRPPAVVYDEEEPTIVEVRFRPA